MPAETSPPTDREALLDAALMHVPFDGWSEAAFRAAVRDTGIDPTLARALFPRGAVDLAVAFHKRGDARMAERLGRADLLGMRTRERIAFAVRVRLEVAGDKEAVRRGVTLFSLPPYAPEGARLIWETADAIWTALGDTDRDFNFYTKRATLAGVYSSTVLYWLGDDTPDSSATWAFLDRRIEDVMRFEKVKANPVIKRVFAGPEWVLSRMRAPRARDATDMPGRWSRPSPQE
ncbi:COQ9 family protein [Rhodosalinus halophilus]|uniref:COQ9 family protein n=1 Tax=Rhodosalinus halophilus TaxID=2259333 RepID=A0A365UBK8_9RHOB|nr:COQ9 family protein [Rhodosalinus halophilus]RBI86311.1 COQ9 family protein [Rhodosalinus halophilus]